MKAAQVKDYGVIEVVLNLDETTAQKGQILAQVYAASVNPFDLKLYLGKTGIKPQFPYVPGGDFAGVVKESGAGVSEYKSGDEVFGSALVLNGGSGSFAEFAVANVKNIAAKPSNLDFVEAASLPLVASSAVQALEDYIKLKGGQKILIHGGAGGIGSIAIQLAKYIGAYVATTVSADDFAFVRSLGADQIIDYKKEKFEEILSDLDAVFDNVGDEVADKSFQVLKKGGVIVSMRGAPSKELSEKHEVAAIGQGTDTNDVHLARVAELVEQSVIKPQVDKVFALEEAKEAFDYLEKGSPRGKVVVKII